MGSEIYHNCVQSSYPLDLFSTQFKSAHTITRFLISILILSPPHLRCDLYPSDFRTKICIHLSSSMHDIRSLHRTNNIQWNNSA